MKGFRIKYFDGKNWRLSGLIKKSNLYRQLDMYKQCYQKAQIIDNNEEY